MQKTIRIHLPHYEILQPPPHYCSAMQRIKRSGNYNRNALLNRSDMQILLIIAISNAYGRIHLQFFKVVLSSHYQKEEKK